MDPISIALALAPLVPKIVGWISGDKAEKAAEVVVQTAQAATGLSDPKEMIERLKFDASARLAFQQHLSDIEHEMDKAYLADRQDARGRDSEFVKAGRHNWRGDILAFLAVAGLVACVYLVAVRTGIEERAVNAIMFVAGVLASAVRDVYGFEFGSSRGSKDKDELMARFAGK